uniref:Retropepsins domain-containing protein n=1 Tax=Photinus pyralis TaxID=7054 RepID=A0A1Y1MEK4_PHOPY
MKNHQPITETRNKQTIHVAASFKHPNKDDRPFLTVNVGNDKLIVLMDPGASQTILGSKGLFLIDKYDLEITRPTSQIDLRTADGSPQKVLGTVELPFPQRLS